MKPSKQPPPPASSLKQALLGLYGIIGITVSIFGPFKIPFAESHAKDYWRHALAWILMILIMLGGIISLALYLFDANYFKSQIVDYVKIHNQRDLTLEGDIKVTFFPQLGLNSGKMTINQRNSNKGFASIENARFNIAWWPLISKQLRIEGVTLDGVHANIIRYKNGGSNFDDLLFIDNGLSDIKFEIDSIKVKNSSANFQDEASGILLSLHDLNIETGKLSDSTPGKLSATFRLESNKPHIDTRVKLNSHVVFELKAGHFEFANFEGIMEGEAAGLANLAFNFQGNINSYPAMGRTTLEKFSASVKGKFENRKLDSKIELSKIQKINNKVNGDALTFNISLLQEDENLNTTIEIPIFEMSDRKFNSENMSANFDLLKSGSALQGKLNSSLKMDFESMKLQMPTITSSLNISHPIIKNKINSVISGKLQVDISEKIAKLDLNTKIDDSKLIVNLGMQDFTQPAYRLDLNVNALDLDRYLALDYSKHLQDETLPFKLSGLKNITLRGKIHCGDLKFAKFKTQNFNSDFKIEQSILSVEQLSGRLYKGNSVGSLNIAFDDPLKISLKQNMSGVQIGTLMNDVFPGGAKLVGKGDLSFELNATGSNVVSLRQSINGHIALSVGRGSLSGLNLGTTLLAEKSQLGIKGNEHTETVKFTDSTMFSELKSTFEIGDGNLHSSDLLMKSPLYNVTGEGDILINSGQISYRMNAIFASNLKRSTSGEFSDLRGVTIPVRVTGPYSTPLIILDLGNASGGNLAKLIKLNTTPPVPTTIKPNKKKVKVK